MTKIGCPDHVITVILQFQNGILPYIIEKREVRSNFQLNNGVKQGCVLPLTLVMNFSAIQ